MLHPRDAVADLLRIAAELLAQRHGGCILRMRAADLDDVVEARCVVQEGRQEPSQAWKEALVDLHDSGNVHGGREAVI